MKGMISPKQRKILAFPHTNYDALICDGAIRSGKTAIMTIAFIDDAMRRYNGQRFGICGKTVDSAIKNIIVPYISTAYAKRKYRLQWKRSEKVLIVSKGKKSNIFEIFGGRDESSFALIQGRTLAGVLIDEVALMPRSFVEQACARCSVDGSKLWFNCNPNSPQHWFYLEWIKEARSKNALHLHFDLEDNPSLTESVINRYKNDYKGVFYQRYVLGQWCVAEGLVYDFGEKNITDERPESGEYYISIDYGTMNPFSAGLWCLRGAKAVRIKEYYYNGRAKNIQLTDEQYCDAVEQLAKGYEVRKVIVDPSAASFITALRKRGFTVMQAKNEVLDGIRRTATMLENGNIKIHRSCGDTIREFGLYSWDEKATEDTVIKENDHAMDDIRYFVNTILRYKAKC
ncbi:MAG: PBSX family phage terminase large subunit [Oscillospiraceae bacterium]|nr:PBSX family phage terminase large subunit [Oscillospiraceae bacterium]